MRELTLTSSVADLRTLFSKLLTRVKKQTQLMPKREKKAGANVGQGGHHC